MNGNDSPKAFWDNRRMMEFGDWRLDLILQRPEE